MVIYLQYHIWLAILVIQIRNSTMVTNNSLKRSTLRCKNDTNIVAGVTIFFDDAGKGIHLFPCKSGM